VSDDRSTQIVRVIEADSFRYVSGGRQRLAVKRIR
jgi:hypothetical protein